MRWINFILGGVVLLGFQQVVVGEEEHPAVVPLVNAQAHRDQVHPRPLVDTLECGFCWMELDIHKVHGELLVGHDQKDLRAGRTLQTLYLEPLRQRIKQNGGRVYPGGPQFFMAVDVKSEAEAAYPVLRKALAEYSDIITVTDHGKVKVGAIQVLLCGAPGKVPREQLLADPVRYAGVVGTLSDLDSAELAEVMPALFENWKKQFQWRGEGPMPEDERAKLRSIVAQAHGHGRLILFWNTPDLPGFWRELRAAGVDLLNADHLAELRDYLLDEQAHGRSR